MGFRTLWWFITLIIPTLDNLTDESDEVYSLLTQQKKWGYFYWENAVGWASLFILFGLAIEYIWYTNGTAIHRSGLFGQKPATRQKPKQTNKQTNIQKKRLKLQLKQKHKQSENCKSITKCKTFFSVVLFCLWKMQIIVNLLGGKQSAWNSGM